MKKRSKKGKSSRRKQKDEFLYQMMSRAELIRHCVAYAAALHELAKVVTAKDSGK